MKWNYNFDVVSNAFKWETNITMLRKEEQPL